MPKTNIGLQSVVIAVLLVTVLSANSKDKDRHTAHFGGLILTVTAIHSAEENRGRPYRPAKPADPSGPPPPASADEKGDHHYVAVFVNIKNEIGRASCREKVSR